MIWSMLCVFLNFRRYARIFRREILNLIQVPDLAIGEYSWVARDVGLDLAVRRQLRGVETAGGEHRDQQMIVGRRWRLRKSGDLVDAFAARLLDKEPPVDELLKKLRLDRFLVRVFGHFYLAQGEIELGEGDLLSVDDRDRLPFRLAFATRQQNSTGGDRRNNRMLHLLAPLNIRQLPA